MSEWKLVPVEPTEAMQPVFEDIEAGVFAAYADAWTALLAAAPAAPAEDVAGLEPWAWAIWLHGVAGIFSHKQTAELEFGRRNALYPDSQRRLVPLVPADALTRLAAERDAARAEAEELRELLRNLCDEMLDRVGVFKSRADYGPAFKAALARATG